MFSQCDCFCSCHARIFSKYVRCHSITVSFNNTRNNKKQAPKECEQSNKEIHTESITKTMELGEQIRNRCVFVINQIKVEDGISKFSRTAYYNGYKNPYQKYNNCCQ